MSAHDGRAAEIARVLNLIGMLGMVGILLGAYNYQFSKHELPCTLCLLQRAAMLGVAFGAAMNLYLGLRPRHYGVCLISAAFGMTVSLRQTALHINPFFNKHTALPTLDPTANPGFGEPVLGLHLYVWGIVIFWVTFLAAGAMLLWSKQFVASDADREPLWLKRTAVTGVWILLAISALETVSTFAECGLGECPNDGSWNWWLFR